MAHYLADDLKQQDILRNIISTSVHILDPLRLHMSHKFRLQHTIPAVQTPEGRLAIHDSYTSILSSNPVQKAETLTSSLVQIQFACTAGSTCILELTLFSSNASLRFVPDGAVMELRHSPVGAWTTWTVQEPAEGREGVDARLPDELLVLGLRNRIPIIDLRSSVARRNPTFPHFTKTKSYMK